MNMQALMQQAQKMQRDMEKNKEEVSKMTFTAKQELVEVEMDGNKTVKKVTNDYETLNFNTAISQMMIFINAVYKENVYPKEYAENFIKLLNPIAPFITEEICNKELKIRVMLVGERPHHSIVFIIFDVVSFIENILFHFRVPTASMMTEMNASF